MSSYAARPTLPPLHTLNLLPPSYRWYNSPTASSSRTPSPTPSDASARSCSSFSSSSSSPTSPSKLTLVPSSLATADAVLLVPPPSAYPATAPLLLTGAALAHLRHPQRQLAKGARLHPYRFARRASVASSVA